MCSIFGMGFQRGHQIKGTYHVKKAIKDLFAVGQSHGKDASGVAISTENKISVLKDAIAGEDFIKTQEFSNFFDDTLRLLPPTIESSPRQVLSVIGHCRAMTKGSQTDNNNNHPIVTTGSVGIHNGCINNDDSIFSSLPRLTRKGRVDSEVIFRLIDDFHNMNSSNKEETLNAILSTCNRINGWYACACVNKHNPHLLWLFRDNTQLTVKHYKDTGVIVFATTDHMIEKSIDETVFGKPTTLDMPRGHVLGINLLTNQKVLSKI